MELASDITPEDLQVFLQEAEEHLQLLDEDFVRLEREQDNQDLLQEIFSLTNSVISPPFSSEYCRYITG